MNFLILLSVMLVPLTLAGTIYINNLGIIGKGTNEEPWQLNQEILDQAIQRITWNNKTISFSAGIYYSDQPLILDFAKRCNNNDSEARAILREGIAIIGEHRATVIQFGKQIGLNQPSLLITFTPEVPNTQSAIFFYQFRGLSIKGETDNALVMFGTDIESTPWNSCIFDLNINNGYHESLSARGLVIYRPLRSDLDFDVTCGRGIALVLENPEFSTIRGSFSNAEDTSTSPVSIYSDSYGLWLSNAVNVHFQSVNLEVVFNGMKLVNSCQGNLFSSVIANNQDERGVVVEYDNLPSNSRNHFIMMTRRTTRQNKSAFPKLIANPTEQIIFQYDLTS